MEHTSHWPKHPKHISFIFHPPTLLKLLENEKKGLTDLLEMTKEYSISLYDQQGILRNQNLREFGNVQFDEATNNLYINSKPIEGKSLVNQIIDKNLQDYAIKPDLVFVIGGNQLRLYGYCPFIIATSEFCHVKYLNFENCIEYREIRRGLAYYANCEQRLGK
ncbi:hypothetical protein HDV06_002995 [Boothiomyces sp. JEL0866]|nr:hypothetical protein HDV06_000391 [Boothiomyces sp. JEL0866]KAJ3322451.1 hypothetical protein HDV06_002995 [Boothiomyces sp. JEL0866]